jgi:hypothetical protein
LEYLPPAIKERLQELLREDIEKELKDFLRRSVEREKYGNSEVQFNLTLMVRFLLSCLMLIALMLPILKLTIIAKNDNWECTMIRQD